VKYGLYYLKVTVPITEERIFVAIGRDRLLFHKYLLLAVLIHEEIKRTLNSHNACYYSVQNLLSSRLLSKNIKIRIKKTIILPVVLYGCET
jgi:hypothetical protein